MAIAGCDALSIGVIDALTANGRRRKGVRSILPVLNGVALIHYRFHLSCR
jgi:hypothetical protein